MSKNISIIIPTFNREKTIEKSVYSVLNQTYEDFELIIVDDGSVDDTESVINQINDNRIVYYKQINSGASAARNAGVLLAKNDWIAFHDSDDTWRKNKLELQMEYVENHPGCDVVYGRFCHHMGDGRIIDAPIYAEGTKLSGNIFDTLIIKNMVGTPTLLLKKEAFIAVGGFDTSINCLEDWELALRLAEHFEFGFVDEILMDAYESPDSVSTRTADYYDTKCKMIVKYKNYLMESGNFDRVVMELFNSAQNKGVLDMVKKLFMSYLAM